jgi:predicted DNA repair protein MutK
MAAAGLLALLDDIATILDDVAILTKAATRKTAGVLGDDLALNAQQVTGIRADRELPVVWAVAKGSLVNKAILVPAALLISALAPWAITPLLMLGGAFLCYEGFEKVAHRVLHPTEEREAARAERARAVSDEAVDLVAFERAKIKGAIRTDFILSAEIVVIALGIVAESPLKTRIVVLVAIAVLMTVGVYGIVAGIVKLDDAGLHLCRRKSSVARAVGGVLLRAAPWLMKFLSIAGTAAMFLVGGGILVHGVPALHHLVEAAADLAPQIENVATLLANLVVGFVAGGVLVAAFAAGRAGWHRVRRRIPA